MSVRDFKLQFHSMPRLLRTQTQVHIPGSRKMISQQFAQTCIRVCLTENRNQRSGNGLISINWRGLQFARVYVTVERFGVACNEC